MRPSAGHAVSLEARAQVCCLSFRQGFLVLCRMCSDTRAAELASLTGGFASQADAVWLEEGRTEARQQAIIDGRQWQQGGVLHSSCQAGPAALAIVSRLAWCLLPREGCTLPAPCLKRSGRGASSNAVLRLAPSTVDVASTRAPA